MEQVLECIEFDGYSTVNENVEEKHVPADACSQHASFDSSELNCTSASHICSSPNTFPILHDDKELYQSHLQDSTVPSLQFVAVVDSDVYVYDSTSSVICPLSDVLSNSVQLHAEDNFTRGKNLITVRKCNDNSVRQLGHSDSQLQVCDGSQQRNEQKTNFLSCPTFLLCSKDMSATVSRLSLLASRVKALCKIVTGTTERVSFDYMVLNMALFSTHLTNELRYHSPGPDSIHYCDLFVADVCISCGKGTTKKMARHLARSNAIKTLQEPYLQVRESSRSDKTLKLVESKTPSGIMTALDITSSELCLPLLNVISCGEQQIADARIHQLVACLNRIIYTVRTILHALKTVRNKDVIDMAVHDAKLSQRLQIVSRWQYSCNLYIDTVLVAFAEASTRALVRDSVYAAAVEVFCKPYLRLDGSEHGGTLRLVGSEDPFAETLPNTSPLHENGDKNHETDPKETQFAAEEKLLNCAYQNSELPADNICERILNNPPPEVLSTVDFPAIMSRFRHLSNKVKALFCDTTTVRNAAAVVTLALKATKLSSQCRVISLNADRSYRCDLLIVSVFVASGEAAKRRGATDKAYVNAAELLQKPYLHLAIGHDRSTRLLGSDEPFLEVPSVCESQQISEIALSLSADLDSVIDEQTEIVKDYSDTPVPCLQEAVLSDADSKETCPFESCPFLDTPLAQGSELEEKQNLNVDNLDIVVASCELPYTMSTLLDQPHVNIASDKSDIQTQTLDNACSEQELSGYKKTIVIARSHNDLSRLINRFHSLAQIAKDICKMFKNTKKTEDMVEMAVHMCHMCSKTDIVKLQPGCIRCKLLVDDVTVAVAQDYNMKSARKMAYSIAAKLICMPYLCLEEKHDDVQLLGSEKPFSEMSLEPGDVNVNSSPTPSRGFWLNDSSVPAGGKDKKDLSPPYTGDLSKLVTRFRGLICLLKSISKSAVQINNGTELIDRALAKSKMHLAIPTVSVPDVGYHCDLFIDGVELTSGVALKKKQAKHAACNAAVELLQKPYLRLQENPDTNQSFKLVGSEQPFVGVAPGDLPYDQDCVVTDKGQLVQIKESSEPQDTADGEKCCSPDSEIYDSGKLRTETCFGNSSDLSLANGAVPVEETVLFDTQISASTHSIDISELLSELRALACRVKCISRSLLEVYSDTDIIEMALADTQLQKRRLIIWMDSIALQCELSVGGISIACGEGDTKEQAKQTAYSAAVELLNKPYLLLQEHPVFWRSYKLVGSDDKFEAVPSSIESAYKQNLWISNRRRDQKKRTPDYQYGVMDKNLAAAARKNEFLLQQHSGTGPAHSLTDFVIFRNPIKKRKPMDILQQSAEFNKWPLSYDVAEVDGGCRCRLTLGGYMLGDAVMQKNKSAKKAAAEQALNQLASMCYTVKKKKMGDFLTNCMTRHEVLEGGKNACSIPCDNIGYKLLTKMGWTGGAVGKNKTGAVPQLPLPVGFDDRAGLGSDRPINFQSAVKLIITEFVQSGGDDRLVFSPELTSKERDIIFAEARKNHLRCRCYNRGHSGDYVVVSLLRTPWELVDYLINNGGENSNYRLLGPSKV